jgi:hypothetical protein
MQFGKKTECLRLPLSQAADIGPKREKESAAFCEFGWMAIHPFTNTFEVFFRGIS